MPTHLQPSDQNSESAARAKRLAYLGYVTLALGAAAYWFNSPWPGMLLNLLAISICFMGAWPMLRWLQRHDQAYPLLEVMQLTMIPFYAVPLLSEHEAVAAYSEPILIRASCLVLLFQIGCAFGAAAADRRHLNPQFTAWWQDAFVSDTQLKFTTYTLLLTTVWFAVSSLGNWVPAELNGTLRAVFFGIGIISAFLQARMWGQGQLTQAQKLIFVINIVLQMILSSLGLLLVTSLITFLLVIVGYFSTARRVPWVVMAIALPVFAVLHNGKHKMRDIYWGEQAQAITIGQIPAYYQEWFGYGWESAFKKRDPDDKSRQSSLIERASLLQIVCYTMDTVPDRAPFF